MNKEADAAYSKETMETEVFGCTPHRPHREIEIETFRDEFLYFEIKEAKANLLAALFLLAATDLKDSQKRPGLSDKIVAEHSVHQDIVFLDLA